MTNSTYTWHYSDSGRTDGPTILFLHGFLGSSRDWAELLPAFSNDFRCLCVDLPAHGWTIVQGTDDVYRMEQVASGLTHLLDSMGVGKCHLVGYSLGGRLALYLSVHYAARFDRTLLESASPGLKTEPERRDRRQRDELLAKRITDIPFKQFLDEWYQQPLFSTLRENEDLFQTLFARRINEYADNPAALKGLAMSLRMMGAGSQPSLWDDIGSIEKPLCLIVGEQDSKFRQVAADVLRLCPMASVQVVAGAGHNVHVEKPEEYARLVREFLLAKE